MDIDFNDPEIIEFIEARAAEKGCSPESLRAAIEAASNLPRLFDPDPLKNLDGMKEFMNSVPWDRIEMVRQQMIEADPTKANWTKQMVLKKLIADQTQKEMAMLPLKQRLEALFGKDIDESIQ